MAASSKIPNFSWERRLYLPTYTVTEAARYAGIPPQTVSYWHHGPPHPPIRPGKPTLKAALPGPEKGSRLSWLELVEVAVVATFRRMGVPLKVLRDTHTYAVQHLKSEYPFAQYDFKLMGWDMILGLEDIIPRSARDIVVVTNRFGQTGWAEMLESRFLEFDYEYGRAMVWHVGGEEAPDVTMDPRVSFGAPTVNGITIWSVAGRRAAGWDDDEIAEEYGLTVGEVTEAAEFAKKFRIAA